MSHAGSSTAVSLLNSLSDQLGRLAGGSLDIGGFRAWFTKARWDDRAFESCGLTPLAWAIDTLLIEYDDFPEHATPQDLALDIQDAIQRLELDPNAKPLDIIPSNDRDAESNHLVEPRKRAV